MRGFDKVTRLQRSIRVHTDTSAKRRISYGDSHYHRMFVDDVSNGLVPFRMRTIPDISVTLDPANEEVERIIALGFGRDQYRLDITGAVFDAMRDAVHTLLGFGEAPYEIVYLRDNESDKLIGFDLSFIPPWTLTREGDIWIQKIPEEYAKQRKCLPRIELPLNAVVRLVPPSPVRKFYSQMIEDLDLLGRDLYPEFAIPKTASFPNDTGFNFQEWHRSHNIALAQASCESGWNARSSFADSISEYYFLHRFLKFEEFKLDLRKSILSQLNEVLRIAGASIGFSARLVMHGLPSPEDIERSRRDLESGNMTFADVMKPYMLY